MHEKPTAVYLARVTLRKRRGRPHQVDPRPPTLHELEQAIVHALEDVTLDYIYSVSAQRVDK